MASQTSDAMPKSAAPTANAPAKTRIGTTTNASTPSTLRMTRPKLFAAIAVVVGHWKSVFTGFQGGDGLTPLGGAAMALFPVFGLVAVAVALVVALGGQLLPYTSLISVVFGYLTLVTMTIAFEGDTALALGLGGVSGLVLAHALLGHRRRNSAAADGVWEGATVSGEWEEIPDADGAADRSGP